MRGAHGEGRAGSRAWWPAFPHPHFMALASLDVWIRVLCTCGAWRQVRSRYWLRLAGGLFTSAVGTLLTLPERLALWPVLKWVWHRRGASADREGGDARSAHGPKILFVLGYYRSGTTHMHYLLSADQRFVTPRWYQAIAPAGFVLSWTIARWLLVPFLAGTRPQDDVAYGPEWPAEDDFAVNNVSAACTMPGRMVVPGSWDHYKRFHDLRGLSEREMERWRWSQWSFVKRIEWADAVRSVFRRGSALCNSRVVLMKTPAHTARVGELVRLFGADRVRFIHLSRDADAVVRSNVAMHGRFGPYMLADGPGETEVRERIVEEYDLTERRFLEDAASIDTDGRGGESGRSERTISRVRYQDLIADPIGELRRAYGELGLAWSDRAEARMTRYLRNVADYRTAADQRKESVKPGAVRGAESVFERLGWMREAFGHDRPALERRTLPDRSGASERSVARTSGEAFVVAAITAMACGVVWVGLATLAWDRMDWLIWPTGAIIGTLGVRGLSSGSRGLGAFAAILTVVVMLIVAVPATAMTSDYRHQSSLPWDHLWLSIRRGVLAKNNLVWVFLGVVSAYRLASRKHLRLPGD
ncbi:MAG: sulfotransferase [Phycisphaeraceae bacterium]|nr:sulfotransferase [Phycisphaeraceae bacterium]